MAERKDGSPRASSRQDTRPDLVVGRGGVRLPRIDTEVLFRYGADPYVSEFWKANRVKPQPFIIEGSLVRELLVPPDSENPLTVVRTITQPPKSRVVEHKDSDYYFDPIYQKTKTVETTQVLVYPSELKHPGQPTELVRIDVTNRNITNHNGPHKGHSYDYMETAIQQNGEKIDHDDLDKESNGGNAHAVFAAIELYNQFAPHAKKVEQITRMTQEQKQAGEGQPPKDLVLYGRPPMGTPQAVVRAYLDEYGDLEKRTAQMDDATFEKRLYATRYRLLGEEFFASHR